MEEVKAPENAEMIADQTTTLFTIISGSQMPVAKTVKNDTTKVEKDTPQLEGQDVAIPVKQSTMRSPSIYLMGLPIKREESNKYTSFKLIDSHDPALTFMNQSKGETSYALYDGERLIDTNNYQITEHANGFTVAIAPTYIPS